MIADRLSTEANTPWNWPCCPLSTCFVARDCSAGVPIPPSAKTGIIANTIQLRRAKAITTSARHAQARPANIAGRSPSRLTVGPVRSACTNAWQTPKAPNERPIHSPFHPNVSAPQSAQQVPYNSPEKLKTKKTKMIGASPRMESAHLIGRKGLSAARSIFWCSGSCDSGRTNRASSMLQALRPAAAMKGSRSQ